MAILAQNNYVKQSKTVQSFKNETFLFVEKVSLYFEIPSYIHLHISTINIHLAQIFPPSIARLTVVKKQS